MRQPRRVWQTLLVLVAVGFGFLWGYDRLAPHPVPWLQAAGLQEQYARIAGHRLRYVRAGRGPAVVLVHGFGSSLHTWKDVIPGLASDHEVVALDLPGFGQSDQPADLVLDDLPRAVVGLMDHLQARQVALVGNSMGGAAVALVAAQSPERVRALVLVDAAGIDSGGRREPPLLRLVTSRAGALLARLPGQRLLIELALRQVFHDPRLVTDERVAEYLQAVRRPGSYPAVRSLHASFSGRERVVEDALGGVRAPTLVVWGREDAWIPLADAGRFVAAISGARQVTIEDCGHLPEEERPRELLGALREFLAQVESPR